MEVSLVKEFLGPGKQQPHAIGMLAMSHKQIYSKNIQEPSLASKGIKYIFDM